jgi:HSP20 family protein
MRTRRLQARYVTLVAIGRPLAAGDLLRGAQTFVLAPRVWRPAADVCETDDAITVSVDLAGVDDDEIDIQLFDDALVVEGVRRPPAAADVVYHTAEIRQGPFRLEVVLPAAVDADGVTADYERGVLAISLPKARRRRIEIGAANETDGTA